MSGVLDMLKLHFLAVILLVLFLNSTFSHADPLNLHYENQTGITPNPAVHFNATSAVDPTCDVGRPCQDKSCCNGNSKFCGLRPEYCDKSVCISNCDAKSECGVGALISGTTCPLNVCCSYWGSCGVTEAFCKGGDQGCQSNCVQPGSTGRHDGDVRKLVIGYWEGWAMDLNNCAQRHIDEVPIDSLSHLYLAFAYITPNDYQIVAMPDGMSDKTFKQITNLKQRAPGLKIWISLGGWTYSDNGTSTQAVWGDLASTEGKRQKFADNLVTFMKYFGFDGVDLDWEYPGAPDRGGHPEDGDNYVALLNTMRSTFDKKAPDFGISFTAPTSYWYLRWFKVEKMYPYANWINLMTYDLHGSWDSPTDQIGSNVYAHTNLTEIKDALNLLWRNNVPADKVNLGLGFYGRSYKLSNPNCIDAGCPFSEPGSPGKCTGQAGILSFAEIESIKKSNNLVTVYDPGAAVKYMAWGQDNQWVSYDDAQTLKEKVDFANQQGLLGLFIWAIDLDEHIHTALQAVLGELGSFARQNGYTGEPNSDWQHITGDQCTWSDCGTGCPNLLQSAKALQYCGIDRGGNQLTSELCCPYGSIPDPDTCRWTSLKESFTCFESCAVDEVEVATSEEPFINGAHKSCLLGGFSSYCCKRTTSFDNVCSWVETCTDIKNGMPTDEKSVCGDRKAITTRMGTCKPSQGFTFCCNAAQAPEISQKCYWNEGGNQCAGSDVCLFGRDTRFAVDTIGGYGFTGTSTGYIWQLPAKDQHSCTINIYSAASKFVIPNLPHLVKKNIAFCCWTPDMETTIKLPVPLKDLFPTPGPDSDQQKFDLEIDRTMGGKRDPTNDNSPDTNAFGFYIMSGPTDELTSMRKQDGSHWQLFGCDSMKSEKRQTVKAVCTDSGDENNCGEVFEGGVPATILEMPSHCGPGKYAVAVDMQPSKSHQSLNNYLNKRGLNHSHVYDLTFDYDFTPIEKRGAASNVLLRIDYSDDPGYWKNIVAAPANKKAKRDLHIHIETHYDGDYRIWLEDQWHNEKRSMPLEHLHKRWWSGKAREWIDRARKVDTTYTGIRHKVRDTITVPFVDQNLKCPEWGTDGFDDFYFRSWAELVVDVDTASGVTLIGKIGDLKSWDESYAWFHTRGQISATLYFKARAAVSFHTGPVELFGAQNFGANFRVPGIVTIGPNFRVVGSISGDASLDLNAQYGVNFAKWDYSMTFPQENAADEKPNAESPASEPQVNSASDPFKWDVAAQGQITARITPQVELGIKFDSDSIANAALNLGVESFTRVYGDAHAGSNQNFVFCYGMDGGAELFASVEAPTIFKHSLSNRWSLISHNYDILPKQCSDGST